jgi:hypothetical protein
LNHDPFSFTPMHHLMIMVSSAGEVLARYYRHPTFVHQAVLAGATWPQVARAHGTDEAKARQVYRDWADGQHRLYLDYEGQFGMSPADHAAAISRAAEPPAAPEAEREAGR